MCGRYVFWEDEPDELFQEFVYRLHEKFPEYDVGSSEIAPGQMVPVIVNDMEPELFSWGYPGFQGGKLLINARAETVRTKKMFQESVYRRRCIVPTTGFFEWSKGKRPHLLNQRGGGVLYLAGLYEKVVGGPNRLVILTTAAVGEAAEVHERMPLIVPKEHILSWLTNTAFAVRHLEAAMPELEKKEY